MPALVGSGAREHFQRPSEHPGERIEIACPAANSVSEPKTPWKILDVFGSLKLEGREPLSIEEMNEVIAKGWAGQL